MNIYTFTAYIKNTVWCYIGVLAVVWQRCLSFYLAILDDRCCSGTRSVGCRCCVSIDSSPHHWKPSLCTHYRWLIHTHTHTLLMALCPGLPGWAGTRKVTPIWILLKQETVSGSGISWAICKSAPRSRITTPAPHHSVFLQAGCSSCRPNNSVKAMKALLDSEYIS